MLRNWPELPATMSQKAQEAIKRMSAVTAVAIEMWRILLDSSLYIIFGIMVAGCIKVFINQQFISRHLREGRYRSVIKASLFGIPLPL